jgi:hypothetical protein
MKCPTTPSEVKLTYTAGGYERYIGKSASGSPKRFRFGKDEARAKVAAWETWQQWENRSEGVDSWEDLEKYNNAVAADLYFDEKKKEHLEEWKKEEQSIIDKVTRKPNAPLSMTIADAKARYLASLQKRVGLIGSLGLEQWTVDQITHKLNRALSFLSSDIVHMSQLDYAALETLIYTLAARPTKLANPLASDKVKAEQKKEQVSQRTALGWIQEVKAFLIWCDEEEAIGYTIPRHASKLFKIRPEAEEQTITVISPKLLKMLWDGCINEHAKGKDKGKRRRLFILLGLNCGFYGVDIATLSPDCIIQGENGSSFIWKLRRKTRKTNSKLARTKWYLWPETLELLNEYMPLKVTPNQIRLAFDRLTTALGIKGISHSNLRDTGAVIMEKIGGRELADTYLAHSRKGVIDSYSHPDWDQLTKALKRFYKEYVKPAIG